MPNDAELDSTVIDKLSPSLSAWLDSAKPLAPLAPAVEQ